eukprot:gene38523-50595_t
MLHSLPQLRDEIHALAHIAMLTNRTIVFPNILIGAGINIPLSVMAKGQMLIGSAEDSTTSTVTMKTRANRRRKGWTGRDAALLDMVGRNQSHAPQHRGEFYWPAFRTALNSVTGLQVVEPAYYHRIVSDFQLNVPEPFLFRHDISNGNDMATGEDTIKTKPKKRRKKNKQDNGRAFDELLKAVIAADKHPRLVLDLRSEAVGAWGPEDLSMWAADSVSAWGNAPIHKTPYVGVPLPRRGDINQDIVENFQM